MSTLGTELMLNGTLAFEGKTALVTGATGQLGRVMARSFAACGADVAIHYHTNEQMALRLQVDIRAAGRKAEIFRADVTNGADVVAMRDAVAARIGAPHIVVNNAVIQYAWTSILEQDEEHFKSQFDSCVMHNVYMAKAFLPAMIERRAGRFIGINTECSMLLNPNSGAYASAKRGMDGLYRVLAKEVGPHNVTVNQVAPGWTISDRDRAEGTEHPPEHEAKLPLRRRGTDQEVANAVLFLASGLADYITGAYIPVCGGNCMPTI